MSEYHICYPALDISFPKQVWDLLIIFPLLHFLTQNCRGGRGGRAGERAKLLAGTVPPNYTLFACTVSEHSDLNILSINLITY